MGLTLSRAAECCVRPNLRLSLATRDPGNKPLLLRSWRCLEYGIRRDTSPPSAGTMAPPQTTHYSPAARGTTTRASRAVDIAFRLPIPQCRNAQETGGPLSEPRRGVIGDGRQ